MYSATRPLDILGHLRMRSSILDDPVIETSVERGRIVCHRNFNCKLKTKCCLLSVFFFIFPAPLVLLLLGRRLLLISFFLSFFYLQFFDDFFFHPLFLLRRPYSALLFIPGDPVSAFEITFTSEIIFFRFKGKPNTYSEQVLVNILLLQPSPQY